MGGVVLRIDTGQEQSPGTGLGVHGADSNAGGGDSHRYDAGGGRGAPVVAVPSHGRIRGEIIRFVVSFASRLLDLFLPAGGAVFRR